MVSRKYSKIIMLLLVLCIDGSSTTAEDNSNSEGGVVVFSEIGFKGQSVALKPGYYLINKMPISNIKSIKVPNGYEIFLGKEENFSNKRNIISVPSLEESLNIITPSIDNDTNKTDTNNNNEGVYTLDSIDISNYNSLYVAKVDLNNNDGIAIYEDYDSNTGKYFGRYLKDMKAIDDKEKDKLIEITIDTSPEFQGLPDLKNYKSLKNIIILFNVLQQKDKAFVEKEYNKIIDYIDKVHPLTIIEMHGDLPSYEKTQNNKFFGFNLEKVPSISNNVNEIYLINCKKLSNIDFSNYNNLKKIYMYGDTLESSNDNQWKKMIEQLFILAIDSKLTHIQLPRTFTSEIPKIGNPTNSKLQYLSALGATSVAWDAFIHSRKLIELNLPKVKIVNQGAFHDNTALKIVNIPEVEHIVRWAFQYSHQLTKVGDVDNIQGNNGILLPKVKTIESGAFMANSNAQNIIVTSIILPECKTIFDNAFVRYRKVQTISIPKCTYVGEVAFYDPYALKELEATAVETIGPRAFQFASSTIRSFKTVNGKKEMDSKLELPNCKTIQNQAFWGDKWHNMRGTSVNLPECTSIADNAFQGSRASGVEAPKVKNINTIRNSINRV